MKIDIDYDGRWPCQCAGHLRVTIDGELWDFGKNCLSSGGSVEGFYEDDGSRGFKVHQGEWSVAKWPQGFPEDLKVLVLDAINQEVDPGCCGGCI